MNTFLEVLESRIAPAAIVAANGLSATYTDVDGDIVTVKVSKGILTAGNFDLAATGVGEQLRELDFTSGAFAGANLSVTVKKGALGDGLAHIGSINSSGYDLGNVTTKGDVGEISAGDGDLSTLAAKTISVGSLGRFGTATQGGSGSLVSSITGSLGVLKVAGDVSEASVSVSGAIWSVTIGGSLRGGFDIGSGTIQTGGDMGAVKIGRDMVGGVNFLTGALLSGGSITSVTVGGSIVGTSVFSGAITAVDEIGAIKIGLNLQGGVGDRSGYIESSGMGQIASLTVGGSIAGGDGQFSGSVYVDSASATVRTIGAIKIGDSLRGGGGDESGAIRADHIGAVTIDASLSGGAGLRSGSIFAETLGAVKIGQDLEGGTDIQAGNITVISTITSMKIGGSVIGGSINGTGSVSCGGIGAVKIGHDIVGGGPSAGSFFVQGSAASVTVGGSLIDGNDGNGGSLTIAGVVGSMRIGQDVSGSISLGQANTLTIGGSLLGSSFDSSGTIFVSGDIVKIAIGGDMIGGSIVGSDLLLGSGSIRIAGRVGGITIGGSIFAGVDDSSDTIRNAASIRVAQDIGSLTIKGGIHGQPDIGDGESPVLITAQGQFVQGATSDLAIGKITIGGSVEHARILAGYDYLLSVPSGNPVNGDAQIGSVKVGGDWVASSLVAGVANTFSNNTSFGNPNDFSIGAGNPAIISRIASITIDGIVAGTAADVSGTDYFGFSAQEIGSFKVGGYSAPLTVGPGNNVLALSYLTLDVAIREVA